MAAAGVAVQGSMMWRVDLDLIPAWRRRTDGEQRWPAAFAIAAMIGSAVGCCRTAVARAALAVPGVEVLIIGVIVAANPGRVRKSSPMLRTLSLML